LVDDEVRREAAKTAAEAGRLGAVYRAAGIELNLNS
jgi:hypothetical protein